MVCDCEKKGRGSNRRQALYRADWGSSVIEKHFGRAALRGPRQPAPWRHVAWAHGAPRPTWAHPPPMNIDTPPAAAPTVARTAQFRSVCLSPCQSQSHT